MRTTIPSEHFRKLFKRKVFNKCEAPFNDNVLKHFSDIQGNKFYVWKKSEAYACSVDPFNDELFQAKKYT